MGAERILTNLNSSPEIMGMVKDCYQKIAATTLKHRHSVPMLGAVIDCCEVVEEFMGFRPDRGHMSVFLSLDAKLKARVIEFDVQDTEVRSELLNAVCVFCLGCSYVEGHAVLDRAIAEQWHTIWERS